MSSWPTLKALHTVCTFFMFRLGLTVEFWLSWNLLYSRLASSSQSLAPPSECWTKVYAAMPGPPCLGSSVCIVSSLCPPPQKLYSFLTGLGQTLTFQADTGAASFITWDLSFCILELITSGTHMMANLSCHVANVGYIWNKQKPKQPVQLCGVFLTASLRWEG